MIEFIILKVVYTLVIQNKNNIVRFCECMYLWAYSHIHTHTHNSFNKQNSDIQ